MKSKIRSIGFRGAFTLVETVLAIGIMGLAITALLGLLPHGIETTKQASQENAYARIIDSVRAEILRLPFAQQAIQLAAVRRLSFDEQGTLLVPGNSVGFQAYLVEVDFRGAGGVPLQLNTSAGALGQNLLNHVIIRIAVTSLSDYTFTDRLANSYRTYPIYVGA
jgi:uncharacterized protein (TIGR02598 family)